MGILECNLLSEHSYACKNIYFNAIRGFFLNAISIADVDDPQISLLFLNCHDFLGKWSGFSLLTSLLGIQGSPSSRLTATHG